MIFVQIASYRDPELIPTVLNLVENADNPNNLRIVVAWQHDDSESIEPIKHLVEVIDIPYVESKGVCWARNLIQQKYNDEEYTLHLDSHHRFVKGWDSKLLHMYKQCKQLGSDHPIITTYLPNFDSYDESFINEIWKIKAEKFMDDGPLFLVPDPIAKDENLPTHPIPARYYSGHFAFTDGNFSKLVPHDPDYYFFGEETNIAVRAFTYGYDLYHPNELVGWHQYKRSYRPTHWSDNINNTHNTNHIGWLERDKKSIEKHLKLFNMKETNVDLKNNPYTFGSVRTVSDYEIFAGINFKNRYISDYTLKNYNPPNL